MTTTRTGNVQTVYDDASIAKYGTQSNALGWPNTALLIRDDEDVRQLLDKVLAQQKDDFLGISEIDLDADQDPVHLFGIMCSLMSKGIGTTSTFDVKWKHPNGQVYNQNVKMIGCKGTITMEGGQAKFTATIRTARNQGPTYSADLWVTATPYSAGRYVTDAGVLYRCIASHTSGTDEDEPGVGAEWPDFWTIP